MTVGRRAGKPRASERNPASRPPRAKSPHAVADAPLSRTHREIDKGPAASGQALVYVGSAGRTRTCDMVVNSQSSRHAVRRTVYAFLQIP